MTHAKAKLAYTLDEAAASCGVSKDVIKRAIARGDLVPVYPTSRPVLLGADLEAWLTQLPSEPRRSA